MNSEIVLIQSIANPRILPLGLTVDILSGLQKNPATGLQQAGIPRNPLLLGRAYSTHKQNNVNPHVLYGLPEEPLDLSVSPRKRE